MAAKRKSGYYWVVYARRRWIFYYDSHRDCWEDVCNYKKYADHEFDKIYETRILPPQMEPEEKFYDCFGD